MLRQAGNDVLGVDTSYTAIRIAVERRNGLIPFSSPYDEFALGKFHGCVCFEVLEHMDEPEAFLKDISERCRHLVISTPITPTVKNNPHHKSDFTRQEFREMVEHHFDIKWAFFQTRPWRVEPAYCVIHGESLKFRG
jgi:2-polyprenyl-3-methyl-5-hydroxy-6-metoxy-1,4-benzoquinol methylase